MESDILAKLRIKSGQRVIVVGAPESYRTILAAMPEGVEVAGELDGQFDVIHCFVTHMAGVERQASILKAALKPTGILWLSYPKGKALPTDLNRDLLAGAMRDKFGLQAVAQVAIDDVWSALRFKVL